jgi:O-antigen biosynthesis protein
VQPRRITLVADELLGYAGNGLGTATTFLAVALARVGHRVEVLYVGQIPTRPLDLEWTRLYESVDVRIRPVPPGETSVQPPYFARMRGVELALRADPPEVVVVQDLGAPGYSALRLRHLGLAFESTSFVVYCHGTRQWVTDMARKVRVLPGALGISALERAAIELADVAVSPSAYMVEWMRRQGWRLPETTLVIPLLTRSGATGEPPPERAGVDGDRRVERLAYFGRLEERKGVRPFVAGLNSLDPQLLDGVELEFVGRPTRAWTPDTVEALLSESARQSLRRVSFETELDQHEALARLSRPGTLAVMPSLEDNSPMAVYECLERGIPFVASGTGGTGELIALDDRERVLFEPTPEGMAAALKRALSQGELPRPARPAFDDASSLERWAEVLAMRPRAFTPSGERPLVDVIVVHRASREALRRCLTALAGQSYRELGVIVAAAGELPDVPTDDLALEPLVVRSRRASVEAAREAGLQAAEAAWVVFLDEEDVPERKLLETLVRAQAASGADAVTCGLYLTGEGPAPMEHFFAGDPGGLGVVGNGYGSVALLRRSLLDDPTSPWPTDDPDWLLLARLRVSGARIVSVPLPLVTQTRQPGTLERNPPNALLVAEQYERVLPDELRSLARLAAGLAADVRRPTPAFTPRLARRAVHVLREQGPLELTRLTLQRLSGARR